MCIRPATGTQECSISNFFVQPLAYEHFFHILFYFSGNINFTLIVIFQLQSLNILDCKIK